MIFKPEEQVEACMLPKNTGKCIKVPETHQNIRWYYKKGNQLDSSSGSCISFRYTGCGGNANNFATKLDCRKACQSTFKY